MPAPSEQIGRCRMLVTIWQDTPGETTAYGQVPSQWTDVAERWAQVETLSGREFLWAQQTQSAVTHRVRMRWYDGLSTKKHRLFWAGRWLNIASVKDVDGTRTWMELMCSESFEALPLRGY